jgi:hypothetical protein
MARFFGEVGYGKSVEKPPLSGIYVDEVTEMHYQGDVIRNTRKLDTGENLNDDISVGNSISIVADEFAVNHFFEIKYVKWAGVLWTVTMVEVKDPRLILTLGKVYNGPTPEPPAPDPTPETPDPP